MEKIVIEVGYSPASAAGGATRAIQSAIDYAANLGGGTVKLGEGVYALDGTLHLRSRVRLEGIPGRTVLLQGEERLSELACDADRHERQAAVMDPGRFEIGQTVTIRKAESSMLFGDTVAVVVGKEGQVLHLDRELHATVLMDEGGIVTTQSPVVAAYDCERIELYGLTVRGSEKAVTLAEGCRSAGIYLYGVADARIERCTVRAYKGDGISYQHCSDIVVEDCDSVGNAGKGVHPGSGTSRTQIVNSRFDDNGLDGIFLCWRVQDSVVEGCTAVGNGMNGLSIGHKDIRNIIRFNRFSDNGYYGIFFRNEKEPMSASYNRVEGNTIEDNGSEDMGYIGIRMRGYTHDVELVSNRISFSKAPPERTIGICLEPHTSKITLGDNKFAGCALRTHDHWLPDGRHE
ncbi:Right handed beta helix region [Cohnella sp. OV330]|uniref:right-handed parallel beta-helix repeat-containing protein n=1 Tax=Cohnella sp. OV330 TaxID=1855288 RepID=UPI0008DF8A73|nr:right-handed parallel beta-helix repeat-containing protein [Cohnella sp. OV330]SFA79436.1 Right handed beta helix region [Cohnella sp. OV330]